MNSTLLDDLLHQLAHLSGVETAYYDMNGRLVHASPESLLATLQALGSPARTLEDIPAVLRERQQVFWQKPLEPVVVIRENEPPAVNLRLSCHMADVAITGCLKLETGEERDLHWRGTELPTLESAEIGGTRYVCKCLTLPAKLPLGYHRLTLELSGTTAETLLIAAPLKAYHPSHEQRLWGVFLPLHSLYTQKSWGSGDLSDLETLINWLSSLGGSIVGMLPLLTSFFDELCGPSPYTPASRLFWNEFYVDINRITEMENCATAREMLNSAGFSKEIEAVRSLPLVDYRRQMALKRKVLEELVQCLYKDQSSNRFAEFKRFRETHKPLEDYAEFRAAAEGRGFWDQWPQPMRDGVLGEGDYDEKNKRYHLYAQWVTHEQLQRLSQKAKQNGPGLYFDFPVGVHPLAYDVWRERDSFALDASGGAPPDPVFTSGQNWGFPPLHPEKIRENGYRYFIACLRHQLTYAGMLRIDHMMGFHRLFWIPRGMETREGVYVRYHADELYAILALESYRNKAVIVGEDLGIVPPEVRPAMEKHGLFRMYVGQYELVAESKTLQPVPPHAVASLNTHDMFPLAAFWQELDIQERLRLKLVDDASAKQELEQRRNIKQALINFSKAPAINGQTTPEVQIETILKAVLDFLSVSQAYAVLVNLEDLWLETQPQNIPGTGGSNNWCRKARYSFEEFSRLPQVVQVLCKVALLRKDRRVPA